MHVCMRLRRASGVPACCRVTNSLMQVNSPAGNAVKGEIEGIKMERIELVDGLCMRLCMLGEAVAVRLVALRPGEREIRVQYVQINRFAGSRIGLKKI